MLTKALPLFALLVSFGLMVAAPMRRFAVRVALELSLLALVWLPLRLEHATLVPSVAHTDEPWLQALAVVCWMVTARLVVTLTSRLTLGSGRGQERLFSDLIKAAIYVAAVLFVLNFVLEFPIQGLLATSGVIAIVLGLALQNTLADVFAGIAVGVEQPFHVGDVVSVADHAEGTVVQMNWRSVRIQQGGDLAIIPNSVVAKGHVINRSRPTAQRLGSIELSLETPLAPERIIDLLGQALLLCRDVVPDPGPSVHLSRLGLRFMTFDISFSVPSTALLDTTRSLILRQVSRQLRNAGALMGELPDTSWLLGTLAIFEGLTADQLAGLAAKAVSRTLASGDPLFEQGTVGISLFVIQTGVLEVTRRSESSGSREVGRIGAGEYLGEVSLLSGHPHQVSAKALTACRVLELPREALVELVRADPLLLELLKASVERGLKALDRDEAARREQPEIVGHQLLGRLRDLLRIGIAETSD